METDQAEQSDALLHQSTWALNKIQEAEETDASTASKRDIRSSSHRDNSDTQAAIVMAKKKDVSQTMT